LEKLEWPKLVIQDTDDIEEATKILTECVMKAAKSATPKIYITGHHKKEGWWNEELCQMRRDQNISDNSKLTRILTKEKTNLWALRLNQMALQPGII